MPFTASCVKCDIRSGKPKVCTPYHSRILVATSIHQPGSAGEKYWHNSSLEVVPVRRTPLGILFLLGGVTLLPATLFAQLPKSKDGPGSLDRTVVNAKGT